MWGHDKSALRARVVVTSDVADALQRRTVANLQETDLDVTLILDNDAGGCAVRGVHVVSHEHMCKLYGARNVACFNGRWKNNPAKLGCIEYVASCTRPVWCVEDDVFCRDWPGFVDVYQNSTADLITTIFDDPSAFPQFYDNGWLVGHPDHLSYGVAGLYVFRMSPALARQILVSLKGARHASHHELFVPWVCASKGFTLEHLLPGHADTMWHNSDPRPCSGLRVDDLPGGGVIFHPVKPALQTEAMQRWRVGKVLNPPKVKLWLVLNSFNSRYYSTACAKLLCEIREQLRCMIPQPGILLAFGGCAARKLVPLGPLCTVAMIDRNLSDYGAFVGVMDAVAAGIIGKGDRCTLLHDTTYPHEGAFLRAMLDLQNAPATAAPFHFAHPLGWYNIGVGSAAFFAGLGGSYARVSAIPKQLGYKLEHGEAVTIEGVTLMPLRHFSKLTLAEHRVCASDVDRLTQHSTGAVQVAGRSRVVVFLAALGVHKFTHGPTSYQVPIWSDADLPSCTHDFDALAKRFGKGMSWALPLIPTKL